MRAVFFLILILFRELLIDFLWKIMLTHNIMGPFLLDWCSVEVIILDSPVIEVDVRLLQPFSDFFLSCIH